MKLHLTAASVVCLSGLVGAAGCTRNPATGQRELIFINTTQEVSIGQEAGPQFEAQFGGKVANPQLQQYVQQVGRRLASVSERQDVPYEYALLNSAVPNAFALPGGKVYITRGLFVRLDNERQLASVLGHETGHIAALHNVKGLQRQVGAAVLIDLAGAVAGKSEKAARLAAQVVTGMANLSYSRTDEYQADLLGIRYAARAGYNPWGVVEMLQRLQDLSQSEGGAFAEMFRTHPLTSKRIEEARDIVRQNHPQASPTAADPNVQRFLQMRRLLAGG